MLVFVINTCQCSKIVVQYTKMNNRGETMTKNEFTLLYTLFKQGIQPFRGVSAASGLSWYVWALYREHCGAVMGESLYNWRLMALRYSGYLVREYGLLN